ncbi:MAG: S26 family signal peptidase [Planctomycetota bacterium]
MSCPGCGFFNVPGSASCVACGVSLSGGGVAVATAPPRATAMQKRMRQARMAILGTGVALDSVRPNTAFLLLALLPGLPQTAQARHSLALALAASWAVLAATGIWLFGHPLGTLAIGASIGIHYFSAILPWRPAIAKLGRREAAFVSLAAYAFLAAGVYFPAQRFFQRFYLPVDVLNAEAPPVLRTGDRVLVRVADAGTLPAVGSVVALRMGANSDGIVLDRVIGLPGDRIDYSKGEWRRNGTVLEPEARPLAAGPLPDLISTVVPPGHVFVWPSVNLRVYGAATPGAALGLHPLDRLVGTAWRISAPFGRRGPFEQP